ncbi:MAG: DNA-directed RNA polymerase subunit H [Candidatus Thermoplasmatota archaeon]|nr:DNA-directed RNA polymerase subunit H [Candidatus Thermoplasmatota archaeon]
MPMQFDVLQHEYVPRSEILSEEEVEELLERLGIRKEQLPKLRDIDPVTIAMGGRPGDVVKITRDSLTAGTQGAIAYRVIVES